MFYRPSLFHLHHPHTLQAVPVGKGAAPGKEPPGLTELFIFTHPFAFAAVALTALAAGVVVFG